MGDAAIVAARCHAVMRAERVVAPGQVGAGVGVEVAERRRQAVAAMFARCPAERPQGALQAFGQRHIALAAEDDMGMFEAAARQAEVVQPVGENDSADGDAQDTAAGIDPEFAHVGEVGQGHPAGLMDLP